MFDADLIKKVYEHLPEKAKKTNAKFKRPLTYVKKIFYSHLYHTQQLNTFERGKNYFNFVSVRVGMQNTTPQRIQ